MAILLHCPRRERGFSLVEMMISITIGLFLLAGLVTVFVNSAQSRAELTKSAQQVENGRYAVQAIAEDLQHAGYYGRFSALTAPTAGSLPNPCDTGTSPFTSLKDALLIPVQGYDAPSSSPITACLPAANHKAGTDILVVRRLDTVETAAGSFDTGRLYAQANSNPDESSNPVVAAASSNAGSLNAGGGNPGATYPLLLKDNLTPAPVRKLRVHIYFVSPCSMPLTCTGAATDDGIPTLKRLELSLDSGGNRVFDVVPLAEGIEELQFDLGVDADGDGAPESPFTMDPASPQGWANVVAVNINLVARNVERSPGYTDSKTYNLGLAGAFTPSGAAAAYKRHAYTELVRVVNTSARRETP